MSDEAVTCLELDPGLATRVIRLLIDAGLTVATAESCTGGLVTARLTDVPGSSACVMGGIVAYDDRIKRELLGVRAETLERHGAVSAETVREMAAGARERLGVDLAVAVSGIAGPGGGSAEKPVGTIYLCLYNGATYRTMLRCVSGAREQVRKWSAEIALAMIENAARAAEVDRTGRPGRASPTSR
jgi:PncC family amidohydrolase